MLQQDNRLFNTLKMDQTSNETQNKIKIFYERANREHENSQNLFSSVLLACHKFGKTRKTHYRFQNFPLSCTQSNLSEPCNIFTAFIFVDLLILIQSNVQETQWKMQGLKTKWKLTQYHLIVDELYTIHSDCNAKPECQSNLSLY